MKKIGVVGIGTAGLLSVSHMLAYLPEDWEVYSVYDPNIPILGIGESTSVAIPTSLYKSTGFNLMLDSAHLESRVKFGARWIGWREYDFYAKIIPPSYAMNFNNFGLKDFCFSRWKDIWKQKFIEYHGTVTDIVNEDKCATILFNDNTRLELDFVIDCRGYPDDYSEYDMVDHIAVNHGLINVVKKPGEFDYSYQIATRNGWMFGLPLNTRQGWGYLYNDKITSREDAVDDISERFKTPKDQLNLREFAWKNYKAKEFINGRIAVNGNRALFYEPLEALAGGFYFRLNRFVFSVLLEDMPEIQANDNLRKVCTDMELFYAYVYHGGSTYDSEFWTITKEKCRKFLFESQYSPYFTSQMDEIKNIPPHHIASQFAFGLFPAAIWRDFDHGFGYHYCSSPEPSSLHPRFDPIREYSNIRIS